MGLNCKNIFGSLLLYTILLVSCGKKQPPVTAFYYWKTTFALGKQKADILHDTGSNLYLRMFDIKYNPQDQRPYPNAVVKFNASTKGINIIPVIYIANETFVHLSAAGTDSLAAKSFTLLSALLQKQNINCSQLQIDCDWTLTTRDAYFAYLKKLKALSGLQLQATIRLHQVKYKGDTGVPPVATGLLMFYNMGKLQAFNNGASSIYSPADAEKYLPYLASYPLPLDVGLPLFSWIVHSRNGHIVQLYDNMDRDLLLDTNNFKIINGVYSARKSFFLNGIYIKQNDNFKPEITGLETLKKAAGQLSGYLPARQKRTIIYYELGNLDTTEFTAKAITKVSAHF